jgi:uncharacterized membrane protein
MSGKTNMGGSPHRGVFLDAHHRLSVGVLLAVVTFLLLEGRVERPGQIVAAWDIFVAVDLALAWRMIMRADPVRVRQMARLQDSSRTVIFSLVLLAACAAFASVAFILGPSKGLSGTGQGLHVALSVIAVVGAWLMVHTLFALRYAHIYYGSSKSGGTEVIHEGLQFPGTLKPGYLDFAYFSFVIGMTSQVSDVQISSRPLRRLALVHGVLSFAFNVVILGLTISIMSSLI